MPNISTQIADLLQDHNIDLLRLDAATQQEIEELFELFSLKLIKKVLRFAPVQEVNLRLRENKLNILIEQSAKSIDEAYSKLEDMTDEKAATLATIETKATAQAINGSLNVELVSGRLSKERLKAIVGNVLIEGAPSAVWWKKQKDDFRDAFKFEIRKGLLANETIDDMVRRVRGTRARRFKDGLIATSTRKAQALVRSSALAVANKAREDLYQQNQDVVKGVQWLSTLDTRTTDICKALDGQAWFHDGRKMPGTEVNYPGPPPAHWNCRSTLVPVLRSWSELNKNPKIAKKLKRNERRLPDGIRASMDGAVSEKLDYEAWLKTKDAKNPAFAKAVLGPTKYRLWKSGKLSFTDLINQNHNPKTISQLQREFAD